MNTLWHINLYHFSKSSCKHTIFSFRLDTKELTAVFEEVVRMAFQNATFRPAVSPIIEENGLLDAGQAADTMVCCSASLWALCPASSCRSWGGGGGGGGATGPAAGRRADSCRSAARWLGAPPPQCTTVLGRRGGGGAGRGR